MPSLIDLISFRCYSFDLSFINEVAEVSFLVEYFHRGTFDCHFLINGLLFLIFMPNIVDIYTYYLKF